MHAIGVSNPNVPIFPPRVCTLVLFIIIIKIASAASCIQKVYSIRRSYTRMSITRENTNIPPSDKHVENTRMHLVYSGTHLKYTDIVYTKRINEVYAVAHTRVLQPLLHSAVQKVTISGGSYIITRIDTL